MADQTGRKVRWGILSTAKIGVEKVIPGIQRSPSSEVVAIASRSLDTAKAAAARLGIAKAYGSYEELLADPDIDIVYNPLPNDLHVPLTLKAAEAGKHVLCEKPIGLDAADAERLSAAPKDRLVAEAFMVRFHPQWLRAREIVRSGELGEVRLVTATFAYHNVDPENIRNDPSKGGGGLMDIGCYPVVGARFLFDAEPKRVVALIDRDPDFKVDRLTSALVDFGGGRRLDFTVSTQLVPYQSIQVHGTKGRVEIIIPFNAPQAEETVILVDDGATLDHRGARRETIAASDQYAEQAEAMARAVLSGTRLPYGIDDAVQNMRILDAIALSAEKGAWVAVGSEA
jgi:predicted dehydrogenase